MKQVSEKGKFSENRYRDEFTEYDAAIYMLCTCMTYIHVQIPTNRALAQC